MKTILAFLSDHRTLLTVLWCSIGLVLGIAIKVLQHRFYQKTGQLLAWWNPSLKDFKRVDDFLFLLLALFAFCVMGPCILVYLIEAVLVLKKRPKQANF